jgi:hypothetical protein
MNIDPEFNQALTRRLFFQRSCTGIGTVALASLLKPNLLNACTEDDDGMPGAMKSLHFPAKAKRIIFLFMSGGPSQIDMFDPKPKLQEISGQPMPESLTKGERVAQLQGAPLLCMGSRYKFSRQGSTETEFSELVPWTAKIAGDITLIRSLQTEAINHDPAVTFMQTGNAQPGRPTMGACMSYGL